MAQGEILVLCTGNAARSVMAGYMIEWLAAERGLDGVRVTTAGTMAVAGQPMSNRTRAALATIAELAHAPVGSHRSRDLSRGDVDRAQLVVAMEADHVRFVRRHHPQAAARTASLRPLARDLPSGPGPLAERVAFLRLDQSEPDAADDVVDPAGGDDATYVACAAELWKLCRELVDKL